MHKLLFGAALLAVSVNVSAAGCLGLAQAEKKACLDKIIATLPEEAPEQKARSTAQGERLSEGFRRDRDRLNAKEAAEVRALQAERERVAQIQAQQQAVAAQQRRDAIAEETLWQLQQQQAALARRQQEARHAPAPAAPVHRPPMRCNPRNGWCD